MNLLTAYSAAFPTQLQLLESKFLTLYKGSPTVDRYRATDIAYDIIPICKIHGTIGKNNADVTEDTALK